MVNEDTEIMKLRQDFNNECDNIKELHDRVDALEDTEKTQTDAIGAFRIELEALKARHSKHSHASHSHLGVDQSLDRLNKRVAELESRLSRIVEAQIDFENRLKDERKTLGDVQDVQTALSDDLQALRENLFGADENNHSSFYRELLDLRGRVAVVEALAKHAVVELDLSKIQRSVRLVDAKKKSEW